MSTKNTLDGLIAELNLAEQRGDRNEVREIRRYIGKHFGAECYMTGHDMQWRVSMRHRDELPPGNDAEKNKPEEDDMSKGKKENRFREMHEGKPVKQSKDTSWKPVFKDFEADQDTREFMEQMEKRAKELGEQDSRDDRDARTQMERLQGEMRDAIRRGELKPPDPRVVEEARRRMREFQGWPAGDQEWRAPSEPPPPELPPDVHLPSEEETMASVTDFFKQEIGT